MAVYTRGWPELHQHSLRKRHGQGQICHQKLFSESLAHRRALDQILRQPLLCSQATRQRAVLPEEGSLGELCRTRQTIARDLKHTGLQKQIGLVCDRSHNWARVSEQCLCSSSQGVWPACSHQNHQDAYLQATH